MTLSIGSCHHEVIIVSQKVKEFTKEIDKIVGVKIKEIRKEDKKSQEEFVFMLNKVGISVSVRTLGNYEKGRTSCPIEFLNDISEFMKIRLNDLIPCGEIELTINNFFSGKGIVLEIDGNLNEFFEGENIYKNIKKIRKKNNITLSKLELNIGKYMNFITDDGYQINRSDLYKIENEKRNIKFSTLIVIFIGIYLRN